MSNTCVEIVIVHVEQVIRNVNSRNQLGSVMREVVIMEDVVNGYVDCRKKRAADIFCKVIFPRYYVEFLEKIGLKLRIKALSIRTDRKHKYLMDLMHEYTKWDVNKRKTLNNMRLIKGIMCESEYYYEHRKTNTSKEGDSWNWKGKKLHFKR